MRAYCQSQETRQTLTSTNELDLHHFLRVSQTLPATVNDNVVLTGIAGNDNTDQVVNRNKTVDDKEVKGLLTQSDLSQLYRLYCFHTRTRALNDIVVSTESTRNDSTCQVAKSLPTELTVEHMPSSTIQGFCISTSSVISSSLLPFGINVDSLTEEESASLVSNKQLPCEHDECLLSEFLAIATDQVPLLRESSLNVARLTEREFAPSVSNNKLSCENDKPLSEPSLATTDQAKLLDRASLDVLSHSQCNESHSSSLDRSHDEVQVLDYSYQDLKTATRNFNNKRCSDGGCLLGSGGFADVFLGHVNNSQGQMIDVAIKKFRSTTKKGESVRSFETWERY